MVETKLANWTGLSQENDFDFINQHIIICAAQPK
jgi:hypothetical protein